MFHKKSRLFIPGTNRRTFLQHEHCCVACFLNLLFLQQRGEHWCIGTPERSNHEHCVVIVGTRVNSQLHETEPFCLLPDLWYKDNMNKCKTSSSILYLFLQRCVHQCPKFDLRLAAQVTPLLLFAQQWQSVKCLEFLTVQENLLTKE